MYPLKLIWREEATVRKSGALILDVDNAANLGLECVDSFVKEILILFHRRTGTTNAVKILQVTLKGTWPSAEPARYRRRY
jgi:hypothetical protein